jgi:hypothetical protein
MDAKESVSLRLPTHLKGALREMATTNRRSLNGEVEYALTKYVDRSQQEQTK